MGVQSALIRVLIEDGDCVSGLGEGSRGEDEGDQQHGRLEQQAGRFL